MMPFTLNCKQASRLLSQIQDRRPGLRERIALWLHLRVCDACINFEKQLSVLRRAMRNGRDPRE
jgi:hypothetical protein